jgi:hypothetical protein
MDNQIKIGDFKTVFLFLISIVFSPFGGLEGFLFPYPKSSSQLVSITFLVLWAIAIALTMTSGASQISKKRPLKFVNEVLIAISILEVVYLGFLFLIAMQFMMGGMPG